ncbi:MAG: hypothetical protein H6809_05305 [Phycisphaeraceae bacterium]|nr:hypothetical protein [Phycisphaeraceae bacterium]
MGERAGKVHSPQLVYPIASALFLAVTVWGFRHFFFEGGAYPGRDITPPIRLLVILHGIAMSVWMRVAVVQPWLVFAGRRKLHMAIGKGGAALGAVLVALGVATAIMSARVTPPDATFGPLNPTQFLLVPLASMLAFGVCLGVGVAKRRRPEVHRAAMFLATLCLLPAALDRIDQVRDAYAPTLLYTLWGPFFSALVLGAGVLLVRSLWARRPDRVLALGLAGLTAVFAIAYQIAKTDAWVRVASLVV